MSFLPLISPENASPEAQRGFDLLRRDLGYDSIPALFQVMANSPPSLMAVGKLLSGVLSAGSLPRTLKNMMILCAARQRDYPECMARQATLLRSEVVPPGALVGLCADPVCAELPCLDRAVLLFVLRFATDPTLISLADGLGVDGAEDAAGRREPDQSAACSSR